MATGISVSSTSNLTSGQKILVANAIMAFEPAAPNADLISNQRIPTGHKQWDVSVYARLASAAALTEGVDLAQTQQLVSNTLSIEPSENGIIATLSKRLIRRQGDQNVVASAGRMLANSLRRKMDEDVITLYDGFTKSIVGSGNSLDISHFRGAVAYLMTDNDSAYGPAPMPVNAALHIEQISDIILDITDNASRTESFTGLSADMVQRWWKGTDRLYGVSVYHAGNIQKSGSDAKGAIFSPDALHMVMANEADVTEEEDKSLRAVEYGIFQEWGTGELADPWGVEVFSDAAATV